MKRKALYWLSKFSGFVEHPNAMLLRSKGVISDFYIRLDQPWLKEIGIKTVLDIGGNVGRFSKTMEHLFPSARIISFEPLPFCYAEMNKLMGDYKNFTSYNIGLGDEPGELEMEESNHNPSSSLLPMGELHKDAFPFAEGGVKKKVQVRRLDDMEKELNLEYPMLIKVDVQGFEDKVVMGGLNVFAKAKVLVLELSFQELYEGQPFFDDIYKMLIPMGFKFYGSMGLMKHPKTGLPLDADCLFINEKI